MSIVTTALVVAALAAAFAYLFNFRGIRTPRKS